jgi:tripartite-type tricarboxylate transporter receptor subunit TctC
VRNVFDAHQRRAISLALGGLLLAGGLSLAVAQGYPSKPVRLVVPSSPGGASDVIARLIATPLGEQLGQPFIVENRVTSGGIIGTQQVAQAQPDGHTLLFTFDTFAINPFLFKNLKWDPRRDFAPVMQVCRLPQVLLAHPSLGVKTLSEFVALAKERGARLYYGSAGPASSSRLAFELFKDVAGLETVAVHYKGGGPALQDLLAGQVQAMLIQGGGAIPQHVRSGRLVALAVSSAARSKLYPELPTIAETYPGFESESWVGLFAPAATPKAIVERLHATLIGILTETAWKERFDAQGCELIGGSPEALAEVVRQDQAKWGKIIREKNISIE